MIIKSSLMPEGCQIFNVFIMFEGYFCHKSKRGLGNKTYFLKLSVHLCNELSMY